MEPHAECQSGRLKRRLLVLRWLLARDDDVRAGQLARGGRRSPSPPPRLEGRQPLRQAPQGALGGRRGRGAAGRGRAVEQRSGGDVAHTRLCVVRSRDGSDLRARRRRVRSYRRKRGKSGHVNGIRVVMKRGACSTKTLHVEHISFTYLLETFFFFLYKSANSQFPEPLS